MKRTLSLLVTLLLTPLAVMGAEDHLSPQSPPSTKKGVGLAERHGFGVTQLQALDVAWFYNWGAETKLATKAQFVPMIFSAKKIASPVNGDTVLGFNEPDNAKQSDMPVSTALALWPTVAAKAKIIGAPAMAGNPLHSEWLADFVKAKPKFDFITVHWYKGADAKHFIRDLGEIHAKFGKPVWVTEFAPQTAAGSEKEPGKYTQAQVTQFIRETVRWMETTPWVEKYAWHDSRAGTSALFDTDGHVTDTGKAYSSAKRTSR